MGPVCGSGKRAQRPAEEETEEGKEKGRTGEKLTCGATWTEREKGERRESGALGLGERRRQAGPSWQREEGREVRALGLAALRELGSAAHAGKGGKGGGSAGPAWREERDGGPAREGEGPAQELLLPSFASSFSLSFPHT
ncbi:hypothetical protein GQ55_6G118800 [Panicum hallii var. hallii]|uniref:Uncharacterized protein n=1 Tax=Panicum hallii var. hallii TaxID=1504633 RepID=A0A2T7D5T9_9POAL|nr:hypothetical protein GQ55_6G118800 [Panicum hallii var. hallii]